MRSPLGYSIGKELEALGLEVDNGALSDQANFKKLLRDQNGSVILIREMAHLLANNNPNLGIHSKALKSKSYFLALSKKSKTSKNTHQGLWKQIKKVHEDQLFINEVFERYHH